MAYGFKSRRKSAASSYRRRTFGSGSYSKKFGMVKSSRARTMKRFKPRFATVGYARDVEKKYRDLAIVAVDWTGSSVGPSASDYNVANGYQWRSTQWGTQDYNGVTQTQIVGNDLLKYVPVGSNATSRIGNKISVKYVKGCITLNAAISRQLKDSLNDGITQGGETVPTYPTSDGYRWEYLRTTFRVVIVKDLQVNSVDAQVTYDDVFEQISGSFVGATAGVHAELKVANMGRFRIISDKLVELSAVKPQKTMKYLVGGNVIGNVRYNSSGNTALTDVGLYVIVAAYTSGAMVGEVVQPGDAGLVLPIVSLNSRLCFTDA